VSGWEGKQEEEKKRRRKKEKRCTRSRRARSMGAS